MKHQTIDLLDGSPDCTLPEDSQQTAKPRATWKQIAIPQPNQVKHLPAGAGAAYWGPGELMTFLITGEERGGAFFAADISVVPGGGTPPHIHRREDESFRVLEGTLTIQVGENTITASPGDLVYLPRGIAHSFKNTGDKTARAEVWVAPAGLEEFFVEVFEPAADRFAPPPSVSPELIGRALAAAPRYGLELLPSQ
jgi:quercetin dioxygenase-like cupin family protein